jgi:plasmid stability protein
MPTLEIRNVPDEIYEWIEKLAKVRGKTISELAAELLRKGLQGDPVAEAALLEEIRADREELARRGVRISDEDIRAAKNYGRK